MFNRIGILNNIVVTRVATGILTSILDKNILEYVGNDV